jgi:hypothetical protein
VRVRRRAARGERGSGRGERVRGEVRAAERARERARKRRRARERSQREVGRGRVAPVPGRARARVGRARGGRPGDLGRRGDVRGCSGGK